MGNGTVYTPEMHRFIADNVKGTKNKDLAAAVNRKFGTNITDTAIASYKYHHGLNSGLKFEDFQRKKGDPPNRTSFKKGHVSHNKGKKGWCPSGCEKTWFQKGHTPKNHKPVGSERIDAKDGYVWIKVAEPNKYRQKHRVVWEAANGPVPKNCNIIFRDGNRQNVCLENLRMVTKREMLVMNNKGLFNTDPELTDAGHNVAKLLVGVYDAKEKLKKKKE